MDYKCRLCLHFGHLLLNLELWQKTERGWDPGNTVEVCALKPRGEKEFGEGKVTAGLGQEHRWVLGGLEESLVRRLTLAQG